MEGGDIEKCLDSNMFSGRLRGIENLSTFSPALDLKAGDCYVFNTNPNAGEHWFCMLYIGDKQGWLLFDCSEKTKKICHNKVINKVKANVDMQVCQLQGENTMTCGEHCIAFLCLVMESINQSEGKITVSGKLNYCQVLKEMCRHFEESPDEYVTQFVYERASNVEKPTLKSVSKWLDDIGV